MKIIWYQVFRDLYDILLKQRGVSKTIIFIGVFILLIGEEFFYVGQSPEIQNIERASL